MNNGLVLSLRYKSHVYIIIHNDFIYIGETGGHPAIRWGSHLNNGTFVKNLSFFHGEVIDEKKDIFFASYELLEVDSEPENKRKLARMAVETELHRLVILNSNALGFESFMTSRSEEYPLRSKFLFSPSSKARAIFNLILSDYNGK